MGDFNLADVCWKYSTAERELPRGFMEFVEDNLLIKLMSEPTRELDFCL